MGKVATEATLQRGVELLSVIAHNQITSFDDYKIIQRIVKEGLAKDFFTEGDQITVKWNDGSKDYDMPFNVVHFGNVVNADGETVPGMYLQSHYALPGLQFDGNEAFYYCSSQLAAGTYNVTMGNSWGSNVVSGKKYQFTLTQAVPAGGQLVFTTASSTTGALPDQSPSNWRVRSYASRTAASHIEMVTVTEGSSGTSLGTLSSSTKYSDSGINNMQRASYGYNRWSQSGMRQWLNSSAAAGAWWTPQNVFDRPPEQLTSMRGFMAGLSSDFLEIVSPVRVTTALNTLSDSDIGTTETTTDRFFLASLEQEYCQPQLAGVEGEAWTYWKERLGGNAPQQYWQSDSVTNANPAHIRYLISNHSSAQHVRLRSANRGFAVSTWFVTTAGYVYASNAAGAHCPCPACVIC